MLLPESVADDHHRRNPVLEIRAAQCGGPVAEAFPAMRKSSRLPANLRHAPPRCRRVRFASQPRTAASWLDLLALLAPVAEIGGRRTQLVSFCLGTVSQTVTMRSSLREWKRPQQHGIDRVENRGIGADPKARVITATAVKPGRFHNMRNP